MRRRLNLLSLAVTSMMAAAFLIPLLGLVSDIARDRALDAAERDAQLVAQLVTATGSSADPYGAFTTFAPSGAINGRAISLAGADGIVVGAPIPAGENLEPAFAGAATSTAVDGGRAVTVPAIRSGGEIFVVRVFVTDGEMSAGVGTARSILIALSVVLVAIAVVITDRLARAIVEPVKELSRASARLGEGDLAARVAPDGPPEIREVGQQFNRLAGEVAALLQGEREAAADLSHRLRTPLTAARLDAERIGDAEARENMMADLDAIERSVDHAIGLLRRPENALASSSVLEDVAAARAAFWEPLAAEQSRQLLLELPSSKTEIAVGGDDLVAVIDALIGNVFTHTPEGVAFRISVAIGDTASLTVEDGGPGFPAAMDARGASAGGSTGLGLDIARRTAELAGGRMQIAESALGGAALTLTFARK